MCQLSADKVFFVKVHPLSATFLEMIQKGRKSVQKHYFKAMLNKILGDSDINQPRVKVWLYICLDINYDRLYSTTISRRFELETCGWSQIHGEKKVFPDLTYFL